MPIPPKISTAIKEKYKGQIAISFNGKILGTGKDSVLALKEAKKNMSNIEEKEFLVSRIHGDEALAA